jgi:hypothetical protein
MTDVAKRYVRLATLSFGVGTATACACVGVGCTTSDAGPSTAGTAGGDNGASGGTAGQAGAGGRQAAMGGTRNGGGAGRGPDEAGGPGTAGGSGSNEGGNAGTGTACRAHYDLPSYDGNSSGLCAPELSTQCDCGDVAQSVEAECPPGVEPGEPDCIVVSQFCSLHEPVAECGWIICADTESCVDAGEEVSRPCASDADCGERTCSKRIHDRMFCN